MDLSKEALQLTIDDMKNKINSQEEAISEYRKGILDLEIEKVKLQGFIDNKDSKYDSKSLKNNIDHIDGNIKSLETAIANMEGLRKDTERMIATLEVKRDTSGF